MKTLNEKLLELFRAEGVEEFNIMRAHSGDFIQLKGHNSSGAFTCIIVEDEFEGRL